MSRITVERTGDRWYLVTPDGSAHLMRPDDWLALKAVVDKVTTAALIDQKGAHRDDRTA